MMIAIDDIPQTEDTFDPSCINLVEPAVERAANEGYEGPDSGPEPDYLVQARKDEARIYASLFNMRKVAVKTRGNRIQLEFRGRTAEFDGSSVSGCNYRDEFVRSLARDFRDKQ